MSVLNIKDDEAHKLAVEIARRTGQSLTQVVKEALREQLKRHRGTGSQNDRIVARALALGRRISARPVRDPRTPEEILGYDEIGGQRS